MAITLLHTPAKIVQVALIDLGLGYAPVTGSDKEWQIHVGREADSPDRSITVYNTTGRKLGRYMDGSNAVYRGFLVQVRGESLPAAAKRAEAIYSALQSVYQQWARMDNSAYLIHAFIDIRDPADIGKDPDTQRNLFTVNSLVKITRAI